MSTPSRGLIELIGLFGATKIEKVLVRRLQLAQQQQSARLRENELADAVAWAYTIKSVERDLEYIGNLP